MDVATILVWSARPKYRLRCHFQRALKTSRHQRVTCSLNSGVALIRDNTPPPPSVKLPLPLQRLFIFLPQILPMYTCRPVFSLADAACRLGGLCPCQDEELQNACKHMCALTRARTHARTHARCLLHTQHLSMLITCRGSVSAMQATAEVPD